MILFHKVKIKYRIKRNYLYKQYELLYIRFFDYSCNKNNSTMQI